MWIRNLQPDFDGWLARRGTDAPGFKAACERLAAAGGDDLVGTFVTLMLMALEYEAFAESIYGDGGDLDRSLTMAFTKKTM